jgi:hypothetical protein
VPTCCLATHKMLCYIPPCSIVRHMADSKFIRKRVLSVRTCSRHFKHEGPYTNKHQVTNLILQIYAQIKEFKTELCVTFKSVYEEMCPYFWFNVLNVQSERQYVQLWKFEIFSLKTVTYDYRSKFFFPFHFVP